MSQVGKKTEYYPTPQLLANCCIEETMQCAVYPHSLLPGEMFYIVEPGSGLHAPFLRAISLYHTRGLRLQFHYLAIDKFVKPVVDLPCVINEAFSITNTQTDFLNWTFPERPPHLIVTNPPFSQAEAFIRHAIEIVHPLGLVGMLLRSTFEGSKERRHFWAKYRPIYRGVIVPRPSFTGSGSDGCEYAWYLWAGCELQRMVERVNARYCRQEWIVSPAEKGWQVK